MPKDVEASVQVALEYVPDTKIAALEARVAALEGMITEFWPGIVAQVYICQVALGMRSSALTKVEGVKGINFGVMGTTRSSFDLVAKNYREALVNMLGGSGGSGEEPGA